MNTHFLNNLKKEKAAQKIQAAFKGYSIRKIFSSVKLKFEKIVKGIDGDDQQVFWMSGFICRPSIKNRKNEIRLAAIRKRESAVLKELASVRDAIHKRKAYLMQNMNL